MKYIIGAIAGIAFMFAGYAFAAGNDGNATFTLIDKLWVGEEGFDVVQKIYDQKANVVCYTITGGPSGAGISCLKNN